MQALNCRAASHASGRQEMEASVNGLAASHREGAPGKVAVVAIHGVADQRAGDTARSIAALLCNVGEETARYKAGECDSFLIPVPVLVPMVGGSRAAAITSASARRSKARRQS